MLFLTMPTSRRFTTSITGWKQKMGQRPTNFTTAQAFIRQTVKCQRKWEIYHNFQGRLFFSCVTNFTDALGRTLGIATKEKRNPSHGQSKRKERKKLTLLRRFPHWTQFSSEGNTEFSILGLKFVSNCNFKIYWRKTLLSSLPVHHPNKRKSKQQGDALD